MSRAKGREIDAGWDDAKAVQPDATASSQAGGRGNATVRVADRSSAPSGAASAGGTNFDDANYTIGNV